MSIEAMKQAHEALLSAANCVEYQEIEEELQKQAKKLHQAIEQAKKQDSDEWYEKALWGERQEPVGEIVQAFDGWEAVSIPVMPPVGTKLYTTLPKRQWVGLTENEKTEIRGSVKYSQYMTACEYGILVQDATEAKLREKNT